MYGHSLSRMQPASTDAVLMSVPPADDRWPSSDLSHLRSSTSLRISVGTSLHGLHIDLRLHACADQVLQNHTSSTFVTQTRPTAGLGVPLPEVTLETTAVRCVSRTGLS